MPYVGQLADIPAGQGTLTSDNNAARARHLDLVVAEGIVSEKGVWEREGGAVPYTQAPLAGADIAFSMSARSFGAGFVAGSFSILGTFAYLGRVSSNSVLGASNPFTVGAFGGVDVPAGAAVFVAITFNSSASVTSITDSAGNTYTQVGGTLFESGTYRVELWRALNVAALVAGQLITVNTTGGLGMCVIDAYGGLDAQDEAKTSSGNGAITSLALASPFSISSDSRAIVVAFGDLNNTLGVTASPSVSLLRRSSLAFGVGVASYGGLITTGDVKINALADYWVNPSTQRLLALGSDGRLYKSSGADFTGCTMARTMTDDAALIVIGGQESASQQNRKAFCFDNGGTRIQVLTGDALVTTDLGGWNTTTNIPVDWATNAPRGGVIHKERLWCWSPANAPHNIYASQIGDHENFKNAVGGSLEYVQAIGTGTGLRIAACASFKGMLFAFKFPRGIWFLDDTDVDYLNWRWNLVTDAVGVADSPHSVIVLDDDILFVAPDGHLHFLSAVTQQGVRSSDLTAALNLQQWTRENVNLNRLTRMSSCWYPAKKLALLGFASIGSDENDLRVYLDFSNADVSEGARSVRISYSHRDVNRALAVRRQSVTDGTQRPILGDSDGIVWLLDQDSKVKVGVPNAGQAHYQYSATDFSHVDPSLANRRKIFDALTMNFNPTGAWNVAVDSVIDGNYQETLYFSMGGGASVLGSFTLGSALGGGSIKTVRRRMTGHGYWLSLGGRVSGDGHDFSIANHLVNFRPGGEEQRNR
jgi:hypothetical protein